MLPDLQITNYYGISVANSLHIIYLRGRPASLALAANICRLRSICTHLTSSHALLPLPIPYLYLDHMCGCGEKHTGEKTSVSLSSGQPSDKLSSLLSLVESASSGGAWRSICHSALPVSGRRWSFFLAACHSYLFIVEGLACRWRCHSLTTTLVAKTDKPLLPFHRPSGIP